MSIIAEMASYTHMDLDHEWKHIEILAQCLMESRTNHPPSEELLSQLRESHHQVVLLRKKKTPENNLWNKVNIRGLPNLALDILACVYAPAINPNVALLYQDLQQSNQSYPSLAFLHRLLALTDDEYSMAKQLLMPRQGELSRRGLVQLTDQGDIISPMLQLMPKPDILALLSGLPEMDLQVPGAIQITLEAEWDDLILPKPQQRMLYEYLLWIEYSSKVVNEWGGRQSGGPIALFSGSSGTGKTFAASVIANKLGWSLYRVDLGSLVSKYIGETEKNLNALFDAVQGRNIILQFDEADALMGKRGEIKDSRDRYANMEVSHLLSRIEQHQGPCILTTNLSKHIDQAFQRRFHFVVPFPKPEIQERIFLWQRLLPYKAPLSSDIDLQMVAEAVALTGGEIRNAAMHAAVMARAENSEISLKHISMGVWRVLQKTDGKARQNQLRQLAEYLPEEILRGELLV